MSKLEEREVRRRSIIGGMIDEAALSATGAVSRGRPKEDRELKKRISLSVLPSLYEDIKKIAYVQRKSVSDVIGELMEQYRSEYKNDICEYDKIKKHEPFPLK